MKSNLRKKPASIALYLAVAALLVFESGAAMALSPSSSAKPGVVETPFGAVPSTCVHPLAGGIVSTESQGCASRVHPDTWDETGYANVAPTTSLKASFTVPKDPTTESDQIIYMFPATQNCFTSCGDFVLIIQPVLQWGDNGIFGGNYYVVASWYVDSNGNYYYSTPINVNVGDKLLGTLTASGCNGSYTCNWVITGKDKTAKTSTTLKMSSLTEQQVDFMTLEQYYVTECSEYPASGHTTFSGITVNGKALSKSDWNTYSWVSGCNLKVVINSGTEVTLYY